MFCEILNSTFFSNVHPDTNVVLVKRVVYKALCTGMDMQGLLLITLMPQTLTWYLRGKCKEAVACGCSAKKAFMKNF